MLPGVFVNHTGTPTWWQRAWGGVLHAWPAALREESALRAAKGPGWRSHDDSGAILLAVDHARTLVSPPGYEIRRARDFTRVVRWTPMPPRVRLEHAVLSVAAKARDDFALVEILAEECRSRRTSAVRLLRALEECSRVRDRARLEAILRDVADGACSVLEHGYLERVERAHGLPSPGRQVRDRVVAGVVYRDVAYASHGVVIELDGRLFHDSASQRDADLDRDLEVSVRQGRTVRLGWGQVFRRPCRTAYLIGQLLRARGWVGWPTACGPDCPATRRAA